MTSRSSPPDLRLRILHLEDDPHDAALTEAVVEATWPGSEIHRVDTREDFACALGEGAFDLVLSDFSLPAFDGLSALDLAQELGVRSPFIFLSGTLGEENAIEALKRGATDYVIKDRPARLVPAIERALEQHRLESQRREDVTRIREQAALLDTCSEAICVTDLDGRVNYANSSARELFDWSATKTPSSPNLHALCVFDATHPLEEVRAKLLKTGAWSGQLPYYDGDGVLRHLLHRWTLVLNDEGEPASIFHIISDVTEQKQLESQLHRAQRLEGIGTLAGGIAHDLNNVLAPILMAANCLQGSELRSTDRRLVDVIENSTRHGANLVRQILAFARGSDDEHTELLPHVIIRDVVELLRETTSPNVQIETNHRKDLWSIVANPTQFSQVLLNLGTNARDAMPHGGTLRFAAENLELDDAAVAKHPGLESGSFIRIRVSDTGVGIPPEIVERIFDPFFTTKSVGKGTGLGLSTVLGIVRGLGGFIEVRSELNVGTTFEIHVPANSRPSTHLPQSHLPTAFPDGAGVTVLVVDDNAGIRLTVLHALQCARFHVLSADRMERALDLCAAHEDELQVVVADLILPDGSGVEFLQRLRERWPQVGLVGLTGGEDQQTGAEELPDGVILVRKPVGASELVENVLASLKQSQE